MWRSAYRLRLKKRSAVSSMLVAIVSAAIIVTAVGGFVYYGYYSGPVKPGSPLLVFSADLYTAESSYLYGGFSNATGIPYAAPKSAGSTALATQISQGAPVSDFISVSKSALEQAGLGAQYSGWGIAFASDQMSIGYSGAAGQSPGVQSVLGAYDSAAAANTSSDWKAFFTVLTSGSVKVGISNPNTDPAGFRGWIVLEAAGQAYAGNQSYFVDRLLHADANVTGASAAALVAPLQAGDLQFLFMYKSAAVSHGLTTLVLPSQINLGDAALASAYSSFTYTTTAGVQKGGPILLFITVPRTSANTDYALQFAVYVVQHAPSMANFGMVPLSPPRLYNSTAVPSQIAQLVTSGEIVSSGSI
jgi:molybdate/tungstate transport system substrate-binding protein